MREYRNRICSAVLAAVCVIGTALIPSRAVHAEDVVDPIAVQKQAARPDIRIRQKRLL